MNNMLNQRRAGLLLHITSLPSGDFGADAFQFVDVLQQIGATVWQTLPLNLPHADGSPYQCLSAHAGNPDFICLEQLVTQQLVGAQDLAKPRVEVLSLAYSQFRQQATDSAQQHFAEFCQQQAHWLDDFALYLVLRQQFESSSWHLWPGEYKHRDAAVLDYARSQHREQLGQIMFVQYLFFQQWHALRDYANSRQVLLFGDIPIFVSYDSADVWAQPWLFKLDADKNMPVIAGVPPDYFSVSGQRWGNPHYNWQVMQEQGYAWWLARMRTQAALFDLVRIDHFRGLESAWEIPVHEETAVNGYWVKAPGEDLLRTISEQLPDVALVAEDLGIITPEVDALRERFGLPGMKILQFAFDGMHDNPYLPQNMHSNSVVYTGTHDNDTTLGWYLGLSEHQRYLVHQYISQDNPDIPFALIDMAMACVAQLAIIPLQDVLELDSTHRMNVPGTVTGNWSWRFDWDQLGQPLLDKLAASIQRHGRGHPQPAVTQPNVVMH